VFGFEFIAGLGDGPKGLRTLRTPRGVIGSDRPQAHLYPGRPPMNAVAAPLPGGLWSQR